MKVFISGATGYIGFNVAQAFRRAGHRVFGLVRSKEKAGLLVRNEIIPVPGSMEKAESYGAALEECSVLIHAAADLQGNTVDLDRKTVDAFLSAGKKGARPKTVIYTSGVWVNGNTAGGLADETMPLAPAKLVAWRPGHEQMVLSAGEVRGLVIRPGCVYGRQGSLTNSWFSGAYKERELKVVGDGSNRWAMVHVDDLARGYLRAAESRLSGEIFNITDCSRATTGDMVSAVACAAGYTGQIRYVPVNEAAKAMGDFAECLALDQHIDSRKAMRMLGWEPTHIGFVDEVLTYFESWKAAQG